jgi:hypothetical protein
MLIVVVKKAVVPTPTIRQNLGASFGYFADEGNKVISGYILNPLHPNTPKSFWVEHFDGNHYDLLVLCTAPPLSILFCTAYVRLVDLNRSAESIAIRP